MPLKQTVEEPASPKLLTAVSMGEATAGKQLLTGFYGIENNAWRWTDQDFSVELRTPTGSAAQGATLVFDLTVPQVVIDHLHSVTLSAKIKGTSLAPETYSQEGQAQYKRDIPANVLSGPTVRVDFHLDKVMPPANGDRRQLGVIARNIALEGK